MFPIKSNCLAYTSRYAYFINFALSKATYVWTDEEKKKKKRKHVRKTCKYNEVPVWQQVPLGQNVFELHFA
jgi:hypothetical protein